MKRLRFAAGAAAVVALCAATTALGGSGIGATFNLGQTNSVNATSILTGTPSTGKPMLEVRNGTGLAGSFGVLGRLTSSSSTASTAGLRGIGLGAGPGVWGSQATGSGVYGTASGGFGVRGLASTGTGVSGTHTATTGITPGVRGETKSSAFDASAVYGLASNASSDLSTAGVLGENKGAGSGIVGTSTQGDGVLGTSQQRWGVEGTSFSGYGVYGSSANNFGVVGTTESASGAGVQGSGGVSAHGVYGSSSSNSAVYGNSSNGQGIEGVSTNSQGVKGTSTGSQGVYGYSSSHAGVLGESVSGKGVDGESSSGPGVYGQSSSGYAGDFVGDVIITGALTVASCTGCASAQPKVVNGNVTTNAHGFATVSLPKPFETKTQNLRYQLTILGTRGWEARVTKLAHDGRFTIQTDRPAVRVSWQVSAVR